MLEINRVGCIRKNPRGPPQVIVGIVFLHRNHAAVTVFIPVYGARVEVSVVFQAAHLCRTFPYVRWKYPQRRG